MATEVTIRLIDPQLDALEKMSNNESLSAEESYSLHIVLALIVEELRKVEA